MTPQQLKAMKLALEALKLNNKEWKSLADSGDAGYWKAEDQDHYKQTEEAITALEEAFADHAMREVQRLGQEIEQEPVAIKRMKEWIEYLKRKSDFGQHMKIPSEMSAGTCWELAIELEQFINTTPPQRTWVGLTDEEIDYFIVHRLTIATKNNLAALIRICEAKLKQKNGYAEEKNT